MMYHCQQYYRKVLNPIVDWNNDEVWEFIREYHVRYCSLYDEGFTRLGCIGCPMASKAKRLNEFKRWSKYKENYLRAIQRLIDSNKKKPKVNKQLFENAEELFDWWVNEGDVPHSGQEGMDL